MKEYIFDIPHQAWVGDFPPGCKRVSDWPDRSVGQMQFVRDIADGCQQIYHFFEVTAQQMSFYVLNHDDTWFIVDRFLLPNQSPQQVCEQLRAEFGAVDVFIRRKSHDLGRS